LPCHRNAHADGSYVALSDSQTLFQADVSDHFVIVQGDEFDCPLITRR